MNILLNKLSDSNNNLQIREDFKKGTYVEGLNEEIVSNTEEINKILRKGSLNRHISSTNMNNESSRSHALFSMIIESKVLYSLLSFIINI